MCYLLQDQDSLRNILRSCKKYFCMTSSPEMDSVELFTIIKSIIIHLFVHLRFFSSVSGLCYEKELNISENVGNLKLKKKKVNTSLVVTMFMPSPNFQYREHTVIH
ncbi:UNVERIFIED_CONTAM: hypothetical protein K2H54_044356 [Gekko kuhli]